MTEGLGVDINMDINMDMDKTNINFKFDNTFAERLEGFYAPVTGDEVPAPRIIALNRPLAQSLGLDADALDTSDGAAILAGSVSPPGAAPLAQVYAGHQFGGFAPQLGDGRALLIGEVVDMSGVRKDIQLKGSGRTPFSRSGDGKAVLAPVLREYLIAEAMHALGVPTTRALAAVLTGEQIMREGWQPGAVLTRVAASHIRVGTLQYFAARGESEKVRQLADYAIARHYPDLEQDSTPYLALLGAVGERQAALVAKWMQVGFVHGVMNTDNMTLAGETIDYGPCAFIDGYDTNAVFSSIDYMGRYAYANQPIIAQWNLARLAETLIPLIDPDNSDHAIERATTVVEQFMTSYQRHWLEGMGRKFGLSDAQEQDRPLIETLLETLQQQNVDFTLFFRKLAALTAEVGNAENELTDLFEDSTSITPWLQRWRRRLAQDHSSDGRRRVAMDGINPLYIPRNYQVEQALQAAVNDNDFAPFEKLHTVLSTPFDEQPGMDAYSLPPPADFGHYRTFCGT